MTDIAKFQSTDLTSLAKVWGTDVANLSKIMGLSVVTSSIVNNAVAAGTPAVFESASTSNTSVCMMDSTHAIVCYKDVGNSNYGTACCLSLSGTTITAGTPVAFESAAIYNAPRVCSMSSSRAITVFQSGVGTGKAVCLSLSETTITAGTAFQFNAASPGAPDVCSMDSSTAIVAYADSGNGAYGTAKCLTLSDTTITGGTAAVFESADTRYISITKMDSTHAIVCYQDNANSSYGTACCLSLSGTTITAGTPDVFESAASSYISVCMMDSTHAIVCYVDGGNGYYGTACCLSLSDTTITAGTPVVCGSAYAYYNPVCRMDSTHATLCYGDLGTNAYAYAVCLSLSGTTITAGTPTVFESAASYDISACKMDGTHVIACYLDAGNSNYGTACCLTLS